MSPQERRWRSKLAQLIAQHGFVRGTLQERLKVCGKLNCRCTRGQKHRGLYLILSKQGRIRQLYVPRSYEAMVRQWVQNYHDLRDLMDRVSEIHWQKVQRRQG
jgi:hypothetical protein